MSLLRLPGSLARTFLDGSVALARFLFREQLTDFGRAISVGLSFYVIARAMLNAATGLDSRLELLAVPFFIAAWFAAIMRLVHGSWHPCNWLSDKGAFRVDLVVPEIDAGYGEERWTTCQILRDIERRWCHENCRGRWRVTYFFAYFSRKEDAALFILMQGGMDQD